ncbi:unnamed protein product, partial [Mesorhabditis belari]|uniref:G-protein coupled receptors family 1 profile domain-containing protein n=1 Tax=Mesorhabditis belari TaxID=2138241 RepID=A0AAF3EHT4_9BILA
MDNPVPPDVAYTLYIVISGAIIICDIPFILLIFINKHLRHQKELVIVGFMCVADTAHAVAFLISGAVRLWIALSNLGSQKITNHDCLKYGFSLIFLYSYQLMGAATLVVSFDRFIAVMFPVYYRVLTSRFSFGIMGCLFFYVTITSLVFLYFIYSNAPLPSSPNCFTSEAYTPGIWKYLLYFRMNTLILSSLLYLPITFRVYKMSKALKRETTGGHYAKKIIRTTRTIGLTVAAEFIFVVIPDIFLTFNPFGLARYQVLWYICGVSKGAVNVLLVTLRHDEILRILREKIRGIKRTQPLSTAVTSTNIRSSKTPGCRPY